MYVKNTRLPSFSPDGSTCGQSWRHTAEKEDNR